MNTDFMQLSWYNAEFSHLSLHNVYKYHNEDMKMWGEMIYKKNLSIYSEQRNKA